jgi:hypothetical protein
MAIACKQGSLVDDFLDPLVVGNSANDIVDYRQDLVAVDYIRAVVGIQEQVVVDDALDYSIGDLVPSIGGSEEGSQ